MPPKDARSALVLGIGAAQCDFVEALSERGWTVLACANSPRGPARPLVDQFEQIDIRDHEALLKLCLTHKVELVTSVGSDFAMVASSVLSERLGLPHFVGADVARRAHNKLSLRRWLTSVGLDDVAFREVRSEGDLAAWEPGPCVLKPADSQGQRGVHFVDSKEEVLAALPDSLSHSVTGSAILEQRLVGPEVSVHVVRQRGKTLFFQMTDRLTVPGHPGLVAGHRIPSNHADHERATAGLVDKVLNVLGIFDGPAYAQVIITEAGPRLVEVAPRLDGCHLWRLIHHHRGVNLIDLCLELQLGEPVCLPLRESSGDAASLRYHLSPPKVAFFPNRFARPVGAQGEVFFLEDGAEVAPVNGRLEKVGYYIAPAIAETPSLKETRGRHPSSEAARMMSR